MDRGSTSCKRFLISAAFFIILSALTSAECLSAQERCQANSPYYFSEFDPASLKPGNELNYEEVYKNYEYFEVFFNKGCDEITVNRYIKGRFKSSERYQFRADGSLGKINKGDSFGN